MAVAIEALMRAQSRRPNSDHSVAMTSASQPAATASAPAATGAATPIAVPQAAGATPGVTRRLGETSSSTGVSAEGDPLSSSRIGAGAATAVATAVGLAVSTPSQAQRPTTFPTDDAAIKRIDDGTYGYCVDTGEEIGIKRLEGRPMAERTVDAQERWEHKKKQLGD